MRYMLAVALAAVLAGCVSDPAYQERMAGACQFHRCICVKQVVLRTTEPVKWRANGDAYCPDGYSIQRATERGDP